MTTETLANGRSIAATVGDAILDAIVRLGERSQAGRCAKEADALFALSDAELAAKGLMRDRIIQHAFRQYLY